jgi:hypothetical protein
MELRRITLKVWSPWSRGGSLWNQIGSPWSHGGSPWNCGRCFESVGAHPGAVESHLEGMELTLEVSLRGLEAHPWAVKTHLEVYM